MSILLESAGKERADCSTIEATRGSPEMKTVRARALGTILLTIIWTCAIEAQDVPVPQLTPGSGRKPASASIDPARPAPPQTVALTVAKGSPLQVVLDQEVRVKKVGQPVHGRTVEPVYAFDHIVVPAG